jgi:hypothetical protein
MHKLLFQKILLFGFSSLIFFSFVTPASAFNPVTYVMDLWRSYTAPLEVITPVYTPVYVPAEEGIPPSTPPPVVRVAQPIIGSQGQPGPQGPAGPQGIQGIQGERGPSGSSGSLDTSSLISQTLFDNQISAILSSIENGVGGLSSSIAEEVNTDLLTVSGNATVGGDFTVTGNIIGNITGNITGNADTVTTNANLTGVVTSVGNATSIADSALSIAKTSGLQSALDGKANPALSNLASVAINTSLISDTDSTDDLGSASIAWANLYVDTIRSGTGVPLAITPIAGQNLNINLSTTGDFAVNTDDLYVDTSAGNIGIGETSPLALLHLTKDQDAITELRIDNTDATSSAGMALTFYDGSSRRSFIEYDTSGADLTIGTDHTNGKLKLATGSAAVAMTILNDGRVGIGTVAPTMKLEVLGSAGAPTPGSANPTGSFRIRSGTNSVLDFGNMDVAPYGNWIQSQDKANSATYYPLLLNVGGGNVGIGETTPTAVLHLKAGTATASTAPLKFTSGTLLTAPEAGVVEFLNDSYYGTITTGEERKTFAFLESPTFTTQITSPLILGGTATTQDLTFQTTSGVGETGADMHFLVGNNGATEAMTILNDGKVGIGTDAPSSLFTVSKDAGTSSIIAKIEQLNGDANGLLLHNTASDLTKYILRLTSGGTPTDRFVVTNSGQVGIGVASGSLGAKLKISTVTNGAKGMIIQGVANQAAVYNEWQNSSSHILGNIGPQASGNQRLQLFIYNTLETTPTNYERLAIYPDSANNVFKIEAQNAGSGTLRDLVFQGGGGNVGIGISPTYALDVLATGTGIIARFQSDNATGCTLVDGGTITCTSDERMKKNIEDISYGLETIKGLRPVLFNWKYEDPSNSSGQAEKNLGFIAQEVEALIPKLIATDENGMKSLNTTAMVPILTKAIQEMDLKITEINNVEQENTWRDSLIAWFANAENRIMRIFTGEVCLTEAGQEAVCLNRAELQSLKALLINQNTSSQNEPVIETPDPEPEPVEEIITEEEPVIEEAPAASADESSGEPTEEIVEETPVVEDEAPVEEVPVVEEEIVVEEEPASEPEATPEV